MKPDPNHEMLIFENGRQLSANCYVIGISPQLDTYDGYDGDMVDGDLTKPYKIELADYMINLWTEYRKKAEAEPDPETVEQA